MTETEPVSKTQGFWSPVFLWNVDNKQLQYHSKSNYNPSNIAFLLNIINSILS
jgi:hypothetical protein